MKCILQTKVFLFVFFCSESYFIHHHCAIPFQRNCTRPDFLFRRGSDLINKVLIFINDTCSSQSKRPLPAEVMYLKFNNDVEE